MRIFKWQILISVAKSLVAESTETSNIESLIAFEPNITLNIRFSVFHLRRISLFFFSQLEIQIILLSFDCFLTFNVPEISFWLLCYILRQWSIERVLDLTDSFTWEDLPTRDVETGHLTAAGWIPLTMKYVQQKFSYYDLFFPYPPVNNSYRDKSWNNTSSVVSFRLDCFAVLWTGNISQVTIFKTEFSFLCPYTIINLTGLVNWHTSFFLLSFFFLSFVRSSFLVHFSTMLPDYTALAVWMTMRKWREISIRRSWTNPNNEPEFTCIWKNWRKMERLGISNVSLGTQWIQFYRATEVNAAHINICDITWFNVVSCLARDNYW